MKQFTNSRNIVITNHPPSVYVGYGMEPLKKEAHHSSCTGRRRQRRQPLVDFAGNTKDPAGRHGIKHDASREGKDRLLVQSTVAKVV